MSHWQQAILSLASIGRLESEYKDVKRISSELWKSATYTPTRLVLSKDQLYNVFCLYSAPLIREQYTPKFDMSRGIAAFRTIGSHLFHRKP